jgi:cardiolipin synthase
MRTPALMAKQKKNTPADTYTLHSDVRVLRGGKEYFSQIQHIASIAQQTLHLQTYIFDDDETGQEVALALIAAASRGVHVYVMVDGYASQKLSDTFVKKLQDGGVNFRYFMPLLHSKYYYLGRRMHHKIIVADATIVMIAGVNISNRYNDMPDAPAWLDWAIVAQGPVAENINNLCEQMWNKTVFAAKCIPHIGNYNNTAGSILVRMRRNDWVFRKTDITKTYLELFATARYNVTIMTSYFWPPHRLLRNMEEAARRGVKIKLVLTGNADVPLSKYAERYLYNRLFRSGIEVYEYLPNVLHGKLGICDGEWATVGSYNLNDISAFASIELNLDVKDKVLVNKLKVTVEDIIAQDCKLISKSGYGFYGNVLKKLLYYLSYRIIHTLFFLFTFYYAQHKKRNQ